MLYDGMDKRTFRAIKKQKGACKLFFLNYEDLGKTWSYSFYQKQLLFYVNDTIIVPTAIYKRPLPLLSMKQAVVRKFFHLSKAIERWKGGSYIGFRGRNLHNSFKAFQLNSTIREAARKTKTIHIHTPRSYFIKGDLKLLKELLEQEKELIVKACSVFSTFVVTNETFQNWNGKHLEKSSCVLPTMHKR